MLEASSQSLRIEAPEGSTTKQCNESLVLCYRQTTFLLIQTATQLPLQSVFTPRKERAVRQLNISARAENRVRINAGKATFKALSAALLKVQIFWM